MDAIIGYCLDNKVYWCLTCFEQTQGGPGHANSEIEAVFDVPSRAYCTRCSRFWWKRTLIEIPPEPVVKTGRERYTPEGVRIVEYEGTRQKKRFECETITLTSDHFAWFEITKEDP